MIDENQQRWLEHMGILREPIDSHPDKPSPWVATANANAGRTIVAVRMTEEFVIDGSDLFKEIVEAVEAAKRVERHE